MEVTGGEAKPFCVANCGAHWQPYSSKIDLQAFAEQAFLQPPAGVSWLNSRTHLVVSDTSEATGDGLGWHKLFACWL